jgi:hypothetical protein
MVFVDGVSQIYPNINEETKFDAEVNWLNAQVKERKQSSCDWNLSIVGVGPGEFSGRGFIVQGASERFVITSTRCLPAIPSCGAPLIYPDLLLSRPDLLASYEGRLASPWCRFVDPSVGIAVLGPPRLDGWLGSERSVDEDESCYRQITNAAIPLSIAEPPKRSLAWVLLADSSWGRCIVGHYGNDLAFCNHFFDMRSVEPGSPLVVDDGSAIGVIGDTGDWNPDCRHPRLANALPGWLLRDLGVARLRS